LEKITSEFVFGLNNLKMIKTNEISKSDCKKIATRVRDVIFKPAYNYKITIFLCGAAMSETSKIRFKVAEILKSFWYSFYYDIIFPEEMFEELLYSSHSKDLLSLENLLAESVDAIVLIPESPGSYTELGAFANNENLRAKLVCVVDNKYKKHKSFINQGPLKLVKQTSKENIIYVDPVEIGKAWRDYKNVFSYISKDKEVDKIVTRVKKIKKNSTKVGDKITILQIDRFLLPIIYLLEPVSKNTLINIIEYATEDKSNGFQLTTIALTILIKKRQIELTIEGYKLTEIGLNDFLSFKAKSTRVKYQDETVIIDNLRLEILNLKNRQKKLKL